MLNIMKGLVIMAFLSMTAAASQAATVASFGTGTTGSVVGGTFTSSAPVSDTNNVAYFQGATVPASNWVWVDDTSGFADVIFTFSFDLTGYDLNTVSLSGLWGIDNIGTVSLNGNLLSSLPNVVVGNFNVLTAYLANTSGLFNQGLNSLVFSVSNEGGPGAFRATGVVTASPVPVPATLPLLLSVLGFIGFLGWRRTRASA